MDVNTINLRAIDFETDDDGLAIYSFTRSEAIEASKRLSELLCWARGYNDACAIFGVEAIPVDIEPMRLLIAKFKEALVETDSAESAVDF